MSWNNHRTTAEILRHSRKEGSNCISALVRLRYSFPNSGEGVILTLVSCRIEDGERWRKTKRRIEASAWRWLENYFDGACLRISQGNIFSDDVFDARTDWANGASDLSSEEEEELQRELRQIEQDFAA